MIGETNLYGVFVPPMLLMVAFTLPLAACVRALCARGGVYRFVWHRPLFDAAIFVILLFGVFSVIRAGALP
jgi:hypothetical protein